MKKITVRAINVLIIGILAATTLLATPQKAQAAGMVMVTTTADEYGTGSLCSLREAIRTVNRGQSYGGCSYTGLNQIFVKTGEYTVSRPTVTGDDQAGDDLDILNDMIITGAGYNSTNITAQHTLGERIFHIKSSSDGKINVTIEGLKISNGDVGSKSSGGGILGAGGGILNEYSNLTLNDVFLSSNRASTMGGGIMITSNAHLTVNHSVFTGNNAENGGAIFNGGKLDVYSSFFNSNTTSLTTGSGGAIDNDPVSAQDGATIVNSTFAFNTSYPNNKAAGGAISNSRTLTVRNSTLVQNTGGGIYLHNGSKLTVQNSIVANNINGANCSNLNNEGTFVSNGYNLEYHVGAAADWECAWGAGEKGKDPELTDEPMSIDGTMKMFGFTSKASPAIDVIPADDVTCGSSTLHTKVDQRMHWRPDDGNEDGTTGCDIGAFEEGGVYFSLYVTPILH